jgi:hypothetical protein
MIIKQMQFMLLQAMLMVKIAILLVFLSQQMPEQHGISLA